MTKKILIVEDDLFIAFDLEWIYKELGFEVVGTTDTAEDAVIKTKTLKPDIISMDITLNGDKTGIDAALNIRDFSLTPILYLTAYDVNELSEDIKLTKPYKITSKPTDIYIVKNIIESFYKQK